MTRADIDHTLGTSHYWTNAPEECKEEFCKRMARRRYGWEALSSAFLWFLSGWRSRGIPVVVPTTCACCERLAEVCRQCGDRAVEDPEPVL